MQVADLFPNDIVWAESNGSGNELDAVDDLLNVSSDASTVQFGRSWQFDFEQGDFIFTNTKRIAVADELEAWKVWCMKALHTPRYRHLVYSNDYGQQYDELIGRAYSKPALESEIERMTTEALMVDPRTADVDQFQFEWSEGVCHFSCVVTSVRQESSRLERSVSF